MDLRIEQGGETVAEISDYNGPIPRVGEQIFRHRNEPLSQVKAVTWEIFGPRYEAEILPHVTITVY
jgi:hypothetical protein